jgi:zinc transporter 1/2/3
LADWSAFTSSVTALANQASSGADALASAASNLTTSSSGTLTAVKEAAIWSSRLTEKYVAQIALLEALTGSSSGSSHAGCSRRDGLGGLNAHIWVRSVAGSSSSTGPSAGQGKKRQLLQQNSRNGTQIGAIGTQAVRDEVQMWDGYNLGVEQATKTGGAWGLEAASLDIPERARWVGKAGRNRLVGGMFLHATRRPLELSCNAGSYAAKFALGCSKSAVPLTKSLSATAVFDYIKRLFPGAGSDIYPYGVDPVFLRSSSLYEPSLSGSEGDYYNMSDPGEVPVATGVPYGYFHRGLKVSNILHGEVTTWARV